jgi:translation initiation factor 2D
MAEIRSLLNAYIVAHNLVNPREQAYINLDDLLYSCASTKSKTKSKGKDKDTEPEPAMARFMKRDELTKNILGKMQNWYEIRAAGKDPITKYASTTPVFF